MVLSDKRVARALRSPAEFPLGPSVVVDGVEVDLATDGACSFGRLAG